MKRALKKLCVNLLTLALTGMLWTSTGCAEALQPAESQGYDAYGDDDTPRQAKTKATGGAEALQPVESQGYDAYGDDDTPRLAKTKATGGAEALQPVKGQGCYAYGDDETPSQAKAKAMAMAREQAVSSYQVWVESSSEVEDFQLKKDTIQSISAGMLRNVHIEKTEKKGQEVCIMITAQIDPQSVTEELTRRKKQRDIAKTLVSAELTPHSAFGIRISLNKQDGRYMEGEYLVIKVESDRDAYLKLDYFQADGTVVHMVPNMFRGQAFIRKGQTYEFGGDNSLERFVISGPFGEEVIKAVASTQPFTNLLQSTQPISESQSYVNTLKRGMKITQRGIQVMAGSSIPLYTTSQAVLQHQKALEERK